MSKAKASRTLRRVKNAVVEMTRFKGETPKEIRIATRDYILLVDEGYIRDDLLSGTSIKVLHG